VFSRVRFGLCFQLSRVRVEGMVCDVCGDGCVGVGGMMWVGKSSVVWDRKVCHMCITCREYVLSTWCGVYDIELTIH
jgi:hypothetical protein